MINKLDYMIKNNKNLVYLARIAHLFDSVKGV